MQLKVLKAQDWFSQYAWFDYPSSEEVTENTAQNAQQQTLKSKKNAKSVKFEEKKEDEGV